MSELDGKTLRGGNARPGTGPALRAFAGALAALSLTGCWGFRAANTPLEKQDTTRGYYTFGAPRPRGVGDATIYLAFSGGGTRAAAFAYGVMEELRDTKIVLDGEEISLLDEVDTISGVSGGSFPAAYYGLYGDRIFEDFEKRFLKKNVQGALTLRVLAPWNMLRLLTPWLSRSDLASGYYDKHIFDKATFADLDPDDGPRIYINATDLSSGTRFTFHQGGFDMICSDLDVLPISVAVAASSAVPVLLSPITLKNHAGTCGYEPPGWVEAVLEDPDANPRRAQSAKNFLKYRDPKEKKYIHLVDGGISDNLGLRAAIDLVTVAGGAENAQRLTKAEIPNHMAVIVVNAETDPDPKIDLTSAAPGFAQLMNSVSGGQIRRYNFETLLLTEGLLKDFETEFSTEQHPMTTHMVNVSYDEIADKEVRTYFKRLPTSFKLSGNEVDRLRAAGRKLLRNSKDFQDLVRAMENR